jgi:ATP-dependent Clp protease ATP-binding subunit ClpA
MNGYNFTERMRHVLARGRDESARLHHEYVGTEHLLLALIREQDGVSAAVLTNLKADPDAIRRMIEQIIQPGRTSAAARADLPYTSRAKKVLELAMAEARDLSHNYVGTEHLLLGLLREETGIAAQVLNESGITIDKVRAETIRLLGSESASFTANLRSLFPPELDALVAAPANHRLLMENEYVRVLETVIEPGEKTELHTHRWPASHFVVSWSDFVRRDGDGKVLLDTRQTDFSQNSPQTLWGTALPAHTVENVGSRPLHIISTELKKAIVAL